MGKLMFGIVLGALMMHALPTILDDLSVWDPSGATGAMSHYS